VFDGTYTEASEQDAVPDGAPAYRVRDSRQ
jgi:hypothetical protein